MKQRILILGALLFSIGLTAFGYINWNSPDANNRPVSSDSVKISLPAPVDFDFIYEVNTRFLSTITKADLEKAQSITDILASKQEEPPKPYSNFTLSTSPATPETKQAVESYHNIAISTFRENRKTEVKEQGKDEKLTAGQIQLLRSMDYTTDFYVTGHTKRKNKHGDSLIADTLVTYMTVVPKQAARYKAGKSALITYLKHNSANEIAIARKDRLRPGKISFTVTKQGDIGQVRLSYTSGYNSIDEKMLQLIRDMPGSWEPAANANGAKVEQELVFFFGLMGC